jgi:zinc protease
VLAGPAAAAPAIESWALSNGARVYFVRSPALPMVQIKAVFDAGSARDPRGKFGLACLSNTMLREGAGTLSADDIADRLDGVGAQLSFDCGRDMATLSLRSLSDADVLEPVLAVLASLLAQPSFPGDSLERERKRALLALQYDAQSPGAIARQAFYQAIYGEHPYAHDPGGDEAGLKALDRADLVAYQRRYYVGANAVLAMVGDVSLRRARAIAQQLLGGLAAGEPPEPIPPVADLDGPRLRTIAFPSSQTHIRIGQPGIRYDDPDYFPLYVGNYILGGGGMVSRLYDQVRAQRGLAYSTYSYFTPLRRKGPFTVGLQTATAQREQALTLVKATLDRFIASGPSAEELRAAQKNLTGGFPLRIDSNRDIARYLAVIGFYRLPLSYLNDFIPRVEAVTVEQVRDSFRRRLRPGALATVIVGEQG